MCWHNCVKNRTRAGDGSRCCLPFGLINRRFAFALLDTPASPGARPAETDDWPLDQDMRGCALREEKVDRSYRTGVYTRDTLAF